MSQAPRPVQFVMAWQNYRVGEVITPPATLRDWLMDNGYVQFAFDKKPRARAVQPPPRGTVMVR